MGKKSEQYRKTIIIKEKFFCIHFSFISVFLAIDGVFDVMKTLLKNKCINKSVYIKTSYKRKFHKD